jgi:hypothetical protein
MEGKAHMSLPQLLNRTRQPLNLTSSPSFDELDTLPGTPTVIPFTMQHQKAEFWCWAAVASSVSRHYTSSSQWTQCLVANSLLGVGHCCANESSPTCNRMASLEGALGVTGNLVPNGVRDLPATPDEVREQIRDRRRLIGCGIRWSDTRGHFVVIHGYSFDTNGVMWLAIEDPRYGPSAYPYPSFVNRYRDTGRWLVSYATEP